jgi:type IV secretory pathway TrbL component
MHCLPREREDVDDLAIIDRFTETFSRYIDSGFGLPAISAPLMAPIEMPATQSG